MRPGIAPTYVRRPRCRPRRAPERDATYFGPSRRWIYGIADAGVTKTRFFPSSFLRRNRGALPGRFGGRDGRGVVARAAPGSICRTAENSDPALTSRARSGPCRDRAACSREVVRARPTGSAIVRGSPPTWDSSTRAGARRRPPRSTSRASRKRGEASPKLVQVLGVLPFAFSRPSGSP
jgi:hypothetical protein